MNILRPKKERKPLGIGSLVEEIEGSNGNNRLGEIRSVLDGGRRGRVFELIMLSRHDLSPVARDAQGSYKIFKLPENRCKPLDVKRFIPKRTFCIHDVICKTYGGGERYGIIVGFVHPDGLLSNSYLQGYNGLDLLECVEISPNPGLEQIKDSTGNKKRFTTTSHNCHICEIKPMDKNGGTRLKRINPKPANEN